MIANQDNNTQPVKVKATRKESSKAALPVQVKGDAWKGQEPGEVTQIATLTRKQRRVLQVIMDPRNVEKSDDELAEMARVSRSTYYRAKAHPTVEAERQRLVKSMVVQGVAPAVKAMIRTACEPGRDSFQDRRLLLSMSGDYVERKTQDVNVRGVLVGVVGVSMDEL